VSAPFRELFAELPRAVFETLQAIGEEAVARAKPLYAQPTPAPIWRSGWFCAAMRSRYGWPHLVINLSVVREETEWHALLPCRHLFVMFVDAPTFVAMRALQDLVGAIDRIVEQTERRCYCVARPDR
jgi:hypothetical protein